MARAATPVVGVVLLVAVTVLAASLVGTAVLVAEAPTEPTQVALSLSVDASTERLRLTHRSGRSLNASRLSVTVTVDGDPLVEQPPVPFFAASGFRGGPTGPFNSGGDPRWTAGERAGFRLASTNAPAIDDGDVVMVTIRREGGTAVRVRARATG